MNKKTILILLVLAIAVLGFTMGPACAATTTIKMGKHKDVGSKDRILTFYQPKDAQKILYGIKANGPLNSKIHGNAYSRLTSGMIRFLIKEQEAKNALMSTAVGQKMSVYRRVERLMPHEMTTKLFEEMANLRLKRTGVSTDIVLEQINPRYPKDKYSSFAYGLWRIKEIEEEYKDDGYRVKIKKAYELECTLFIKGEDDDDDEEE